MVDFPEQHGGDSAADEAPAKADSDAVLRIELDGAAGQRALKQDAIPAPPPSASASPDAPAPAFEAPPPPQPALEAAPAPPPPARLR